MTPDERTLLNQFLGDLSRTQGVIKDQEAAAMIETALRGNPDGAYVLVQHALLADQALHRAQAQIMELQARAAPSSQPSFLGQSGPGAQPAQASPPWSSNPWAAPAAPQQPSPWAQSAPPAAAPGGFMGQSPLSSGGGLGSFLRTAGTTAAGVAGGEMLFSGLSGLFGGHGGGFGGGGFGGGGEENVTVNNYGDDQDDGGGSGDGDDYS